VKAKSRGGEEAARGWGGGAASLVLVLVACGMRLFCGLVDVLWCLVGCCWFRGGMCGMGRGVGGCVECRYRSIIIIYIL